MGGSSSTTFCKVSPVPMSLYIPFIFNVACVDISLTDLKPEVKVVSSPRGVVIWFSFLNKFEVTGTKTNSEAMFLRDSAKWCS